MFGVFLLGGVFVAVCAALANAHRPLVQIVDPNLLVLVGRVVAMIGARRIHVGRFITATRETDVGRVDAQAAVVAHFATTGISTHDSDSSDHLYSRRSPGLTLV